MRRGIRQAGTAGPGWWHELYQAAVAAGNGWVGWYNRVIPVTESPVGPVVVRVPIADAAGVDARRWPEHLVMAAVARHVRVPRVRHVSADPPYQIHQLVSGAVLHDLAPPGTAVPGRVIGQLADLFARLADVPASALPAGPADWPSRVDTVGFAARMVDYAAIWHQRSCADGHGPLHARLGIPADPFATVRARLADLTPRRLVLVHTDVHRRNIILAGPTGECVWLDWDLATWGDPVYDVALHIAKMHYQPSDRDNLLRRWLTVMPPDCVAGWEPDLAAYTMYEQVRGAVAFADRLGRLTRHPYPAPDPLDALVTRLARRLSEAHQHWHGTSRPVTHREVADALTWWAVQAV